MQVDEASAAYYRSLSGELGDKLREVLSTEDGETVMTIVEGRCPMWRQDGLCRIQAELGEAALCKTCREFPRLTHDYGDFLELGLELSCPEAAKFILNAAEVSMQETQVPGGEEPEYDIEAMDVLKSTRERARRILAESDENVGRTLAALLLWGYQAQGELDGEPPAEFDKNTALSSVSDLVQRALSSEQQSGFDEQNGHFLELGRFFSGLEILTEAWKDRLDAAGKAPLSPKVIPLARYLVDRYWLQAVSDYDLYCRVKFIVVSCILVSGLGGDFVETAQLYSKEIENNIDNVEAILDAAYCHPAFTDDKILGLLLASP